MVPSSATELVLVAALNLLGAKLEVLRALDHQVGLGLALLAFKAQGDLLGGLRLLVEDGLGLPPEPSLLAVVPPLACVRAITTV